MNRTEKLIEKYLHFSGERTYLDLINFHHEVDLEKVKFKPGSYEYVCLEYIRQKLQKGIGYSLQHNNALDIVIEDTRKDIEHGYDQSKDETKKKRLRHKKPVKPKKKDNSDELGKLVDHGEELPDGNSDRYWGREGVDLVFRPNDEAVRKGDKVPSTYKYADVRFLENFYGLNAFEFGNWLSQQDRINYLSGLGLALFDLHKLFDFSPRQIGLKGKLSVAFGARGRGKALAHFEPSAFVINLTRYSRPEKLEKRKSGFKRVSLILQDGGVGSFAHEYAHALDYYAGTYLEKADDWQISGGRSTDTDMRYPSLKKPKIQALMDNLMNKIIWKSKNIPSDYYKRLNRKGTKEYFLRRNEMWARAFEVYIHYKLERKKQKNVFLNKSKYPERYYLTFSEMNRLKKDFDALISEFKKHL